MLKEKMKRVNELEKKKVMLKFKSYLHLLLQTLLSLTETSNEGKLNFKKKRVD
jgi:hypothetical protein